MALGVDALGFVFYGPSPRHITIARAAEIVARLPPFVCKVGLFVDADTATIREVLAHVPIDIVQFHGEESAEECEQIDRPYIKAIRMAEDVELPEVAERYGSAAGLLLDACEPGAVGGTGSAFDWSRVPAGLARPIVLAGGLDAANVGEAIRTVRPFAVDVSSGIERGKGVKDPARMTEFLNEVWSVER